MVDEYEDFIGNLVKIRSVFFRKDIVLLVIQNDEKQIQVNYGKAGASSLIIGQSFAVGHIGKRLINIRPLSHSTFPKSINEEKYHCIIRGGEITQIECLDIQNIKRKPEECDSIDIDLVKADMECPLCSFHQ